MGTSSARPEDLDRFAARSLGADDTLRSHKGRLRSEYASFLDGTEWGVLDIHSLLAGFGTFIDYNEIDARWVAKIAQAFRHAGGDGQVKTLPDAAIHASLKAAGLLGGRAHVTFDDPVAYGMPPTTGYANDPVNTASGNFVEIEDDLPFDGLIGGLRLARTYNSRSEHPGAFGPGWSSWADARLIARADGAEYIGPDGQRAVFARMGAGYGRVLGINALVEPGESGLALRWFGGAHWHFDEAGLPVLAVNDPGTDVRFEHADGRVTGLRHPGGRTVRLHWEHERISAVESSDGRAVTYRYEHGHLVEADGRRYEIGDAGRVLSVTDADGVVEVANAYDDDGRVIHQLSPFGRNTRFAYLPGHVTVTSDDTDGPANVYVHDTRGRLVSLIAGDETRISFQYDANGNPVAVTDRKGAVTVQEWDERANLVRRILPTGVEIGFTHDDRDRVVDVTASTGGRITHVYEGDERSPAELIDAEGGVTRMDVRGGLVHAITDPDGVRVAFGFDTDGNLISATDADGHTAHLERDAAGTIVAAVSPLGRRTTFVTDSAGRPVERHEPGGAVWRYEYSPAGRVTAVVDPSGARVETRYGEHGETAETVDPLGRVTRHAYDVLGNHTEVVEPGGATWRFAYDELCRLTRVSDPTGATWLREYDAGGNLSASVDPAGTRYEATYDRLSRVTGIFDGVTSASFDYDVLGRCVANTRPDGTAARATYDRMGRMTSSEDPLGGTTTTEFTPAGRVHRVTDPTGAVMTFEYDRCGRPAARVDAAGRRWAFRYDADGALVGSRAADGTVERLAYDEAGRLVEHHVPGRGLTLYAYDDAGQTVAITDSATGTRRFAYDAAGQLVAVTDANGGVTRFAYDPRGRVTEITDPLGATVTRAYDAANRLVREVDALGRETHWTYNAAGRLTAHADGAGRRREWHYDASGSVCAFGATGREPVRITRDALGRTTAVEEPDGRTHAYAWDRAGRLIERRRDDLALSYGYDDYGRRAFIGYPDGSRTHYRYEGGLLASLQHPETGTIAFERDAAGRVVGCDDGRWEYEDGHLVGYAWGTRSARLTRDAAGRVIAAAVDGLPEQHFAYDAAGQLIAAGDRAFTYDAGGRLVQERSPFGAVEYAYDAAGQLVSRDGTRYEYDGSGRRVRDGERELRWDALGHLAAVGDTVVDVDALGELAAVDGTALLWDTADPLAPLAWMGDRPVIAEASERDWQGTVGAPRDPFGAPLAPTPGLQLGYRGELEFAGLTWLRARAYDPATRAFVSPDPLPPVLGTGHSANPYHYAGNDPLGKADPLGLRPVTEQELRDIRDRMGQSWITRNKDWVIAGALIVGGVVVMATGVGGPIGAAMIGGALLSAGSSAAVQKVTTGSVNYKEVAVAGLVGGLAGGAGAYIGSARALATMSPVMRGMVAGGASNALGGAANRGIHGDNPFDPAGMATDLVVGGATGGVGWRLGRNEPEVYYRGMSPEELASVRSVKGITPRGENFVTQDRAYIEQLAARHPGTYDNVVRFEMRPGTTDAMVDAGATSRSGLIDSNPRYADLPRIGRGDTTHIHIKGEGSSVNYGLRSGSADVFNTNIQGIR